MRDITIRLPDDGRSTSRNVAHLNILVHDMINYCNIVKDYISATLIVKLKNSATFNSATLNTVP